MLLSCPAVAKEHAHDRPPLALARRAHEHGQKSDFWVMDACVRGQVGRAMMACSV